MHILVIDIVWWLLQILIGYNLVLPLLLFLLYTVVKKQYTTVSTTAAEVSYGIIVTAYEQVHTLPAVVQSILQLQYTNYKIYIVADKCDISTLHFNDDRVIVLRPPTTLASNTKSHFYAINNFVQPHERLTIIDSDNLVHPNYLNALNKYFDIGFEAVQGIREAKNLNTTYACLDAARDIYYHFFDGKVLFALGSSATLAGSGMAFTTQLYKDCLEHNNVSGAGFDKVLQHAIVSKGKRIAFTDKAIVYDEKTSHSDQLVKQRARWINTWFKYFGYGFGLVFKGIVGFNFNQLLFGIILLRPPLFIFLILSAIFMCINMVLFNVVAVAWWLVAFLSFVVSFTIALNMGKTDKRIYASLRNIPKFMFYQILSLLKVHKANKISVATQHMHNTQIEEVKK
jgi:cellulose synthase/poly-beta-1,6-N-acetylglucosamine synthase-like glycosyltransferase